MANPGRLNPKRISRPIRFRVSVKTLAIHLENRSCGDVPPVRRCIALPVPDSIGSRKNPRNLPAIQSPRIATAFLQPEIRDTFQFLHPFRLRDGAAKPREDMNVVFYATDLNWRAIQLFGNAAQIRMQRIARGFIAQQWATVFGGKDEMNVNGGKRLWHRYNRYARRTVVCQSQRDCDLQPKVATTIRGYLGCGSKKETTPTALWKGRG